MEDLLRGGIGYAPLATGRPFVPRFGFEGTPLGQHPLLGLLAQPFGQRLMAGAGYAPFGLGHDQNIYDILRVQQFTLQQREALQVAAQRDRDSYLRTFRGVSAMAGLPFGPEQRRAAQSLADTTAMAAPLMAMMAPDFLDQLGGLRGSATVLTHHLMDAGRYRLDPVTGRTGMSGLSAGLLGQQLYDATADPRTFRGLTAGQVGSMFTEMQYRGLLPGGLPDTRRAVTDLGRNDPGMLGRAAASQGVTLPQDLNKLSATDLDKLTLDPQVADRLRSFDVDKVKRSLESYAKAVSAMRDIFGDMGRPNAPMRELVAGLEALTQGSLHQLDPGRLGQMALQTYNLAKGAGVGMDAALMLQNHAAARNAQFGLEPIFAVQTAQGGLAMNAAYRQLGFGNNRAWGAMDANQFTQADINLRAGATSSAMFNRLSAVMRLRDQAGGFQPGSEAAALAEALEAGQNQFLDPRTGRARSVNVGDTDLIRMLTGSHDRLGRQLRFSESDIRDLFDQRDTNREYGERFGLTRVVRQAQNEEFTPFVASQLQNTLMSRLVTAGAGADRARLLSGQMSGVAAGRIMGSEIGDAQFANPRERSRAIARILDQELGRAGGADLFQKMTPDERQQFLELTADQFVGGVNMAKSRSRFAGVGNNFVDARRLLGPAAFEAADVADQEARFQTSMQQAMTHLGRGTMLSRAMDYLQNAGTTDEAKLGGLVASALGGVKREDLHRALTPQLIGLHRQRQKLEDLQRRLGRAVNPAERAGLTKQIREELAVLERQSVDVGRLGREFGLHGDFGVGADDLDKALANQRTLTGMSADLLGLGQTGVVSDERADIAYRYYQGRRVSQDEAVDSIRARRAAELDDPNWRPSAALAAWVKERYGHFNEDQQIAVARKITEAQGQYIGEADVRREMDPATRTKVNDLGAQRRFGRRLEQLARNRVPLRATDAQVAALAQQHRLGEDEARMLGDMEQRAKRFGIFEDEIQRYSQGGAVPRAVAIHHALLARDDASLAEPSEAELGQVAREAGIDISTPAGRERAAAAVMERRVSSHRERLGRFFGSEDGATFRTAVERQSADAESVISQLLENPDAVRTFGARGIGAAERLQGLQLKRRQLALQYAGGDLSRLQARDFNLDLADPRQRAKAQALKGELAGLDVAFERELRGLRGQLGRPGQRKFAGSDREEAAALLGLTDAEAARILGSDPSALSGPEQSRRAELEQVMGAVGSFRKIGDLGEIDALGNFVRQNQALAAKAQELGISDTELLALGGGKDVATKRPLADHEKANLKALVGDYEAAKTRIAGIAQRTGADTPAKITALANLPARYEAFQRLRRGEANLPAEEMLKRLMALHGVQGGDVQALAGQLQGPEGRYLLRVLHEDASLLSRTAEGALGRLPPEQTQRLRADRIGTLLDEYRTAMGSGDDGQTQMAFRKRYGLVDDESFRTFQGAVERQGVLRQHSLGGAASDRDKANDIATGVQRIVAGRPGGTGGPVDVRLPNGMQVQLTGSVKIEGGAMTFNDRTMGNIHNVATV